MSGSAGPPCPLPSAGAGRPPRERSVRSAGSAGPPGLLSVRSSAADWGVGVPPSTPRARWCEARERQPPGMRSRCSSREIPSREKPVRARTAELSRGSGEILGQGKHLAARAVAAAASGEAVGERRRPGARPLPGYDGSAFGALSRPRCGRTRRAGRTSRSAASR